MTEDNSKHYLKHFDPDGAPTPNIEAMAAHGVTFDRAFSCAPVCSVARSTLITACYAPRIGTQFHRRHTLATMPRGVKMFPAYLRKSGYYTTNNAKEDYNAVKSADVWNESSARASWRNRPTDSTPFFHVQTLARSHESSLHFPAQAMQIETVTDPNSLRLQPYFPDTPVFRYTRARYHDRMRDIDLGVGKILAELESAGELEHTFVFCFGDHGGVLPRSKGYAYEAGLHVPLVIRIPEKYRKLAARELGSRSDGFVEFVDFGPTVLSLAGVTPPADIDGRAFMGRLATVDEVDRRNVAFGYADRFDEKYELVRTLRQGKFKYIRNFEPFLPDGLQNNYRYRMLAYAQWREFFEAGTLNEIQRQFFERKEPEALYDLETDPHEIVNLVSDPTHSALLNEMRQSLMDRLKSMPDLSFFPEAVLVEEMSNPVDFGERNRESIAALIDTANLALLTFDVAAPRIEKALASDEPWIRYWALVVCSSFGSQAESLLPAVEKVLGDDEPLVAMRAIECLAMAHHGDLSQPLYELFSRAANPPAGLQMLNTAVFLRDFSGGRFSIDASKIKFAFQVAAGGEIQRRLDYLSQ